MIKKLFYPILLFFFVGMSCALVIAQSYREIQIMDTEQSESMKKNFIGYKLVSLDRLDSLYEVKRYTLKTQELYGVDETIEVYNVNVAGIALFSVLPDFMSESNWTAMELEDIQESILSYREFYEMVVNKSLSNISGKKAMNFLLVRKENDQYWVSNVCLLELFTPHAYVSDMPPSIFNVQQGTINIRQTPISIAQMMEIYKETSLFLEDRPFPLDFREVRFSLIPNRPAVEREYFSRIIDIRGEQAYQFWTLTDWSSPSTYSYNRGVDRFIYMPDKGIVGGSYDFYFLVEFDRGWDRVFNIKGDLRPRYRKTMDELWQNVIQEKVMLAEELK